MENKKPKKQNPKQDIVKTKIKKIDLYVLIFLGFFILISGFSKIGIAMAVPFAIFYGVIREYIEEYIRKNP